MSQLSSRLETQRLETQRLETQRMGDIGLVDLLDRVLDAGVVISGDIILSLADIDLVYVNLRVLLGSVDTLFPPAAPSSAPP
jgi:hypothetical protein